MLLSAKQWISRVDFCSFLRGGRFPEQNHHICLPTCGFLLSPARSHGFPVMSHVDFCSFLRAVGVPLWISFTSTQTISCEFLLIPARCMRILRHNPHDAAHGTSSRPTVTDICNSYHDLRALTVNEHCVCDHVSGPPNAGRTTTQ